MVSIWMWKEAWKSESSHEKSVRIAVNLDQTQTRYFQNTNRHIERYRYTNPVDATLQSGEG
jgi:hypothetical protein